MKRARDARHLVGLRSSPRRSRSMRLAQLTLVFFASLPLAALGCDKTSDKPKADIANPVAVSSAQKAGAHEQLALATGSKVEWIGAKVTKSHPGSFSGL